MKRLYTILIATACRALYAGPSIDDTDRLFLNAIQELDNNFATEVTAMEDSTKTQDSLNSWYKFLNKGIHDQFAKWQDETISKFRVESNNLIIALVPASELYRLNLQDNPDLNALVKALKKYNNDLKDQLFFATRDYIKKIDLKNKAEQELQKQMSGVVLPSFNTELNELKKESTWQPVKDFTSSLIGSFNKDIKPKLLENAKKAGMEALNKLKGSVLGAIKAKK